MTRRWRHVVGADTRTPSERSDDAAWWHGSNGGILTGAGVLALGVAILSGAWALLVVGLGAIALGVGFIVRGLQRRTLARKLLWVSAYLSAFVVGFVVAWALDSQLVLFLTAAAVVFGGFALANRVAPENADA